MVEKKKDEYYTITCLCCGSITKKLLPQNVIKGQVNELVCDFCGATVKVRIPVTGMDK